MNWETYIAFGDSITIGARTYLGYPELTGMLLQKKLSKLWDVVNHSVNGFNAIDLARHIDSYYSNLKEHKASISSILIGTNDIKEGVPVFDFEIALNQIIIKSKLLTQNNNVILFHIPEFQTGIMYPYTIDMNKWVKVYNKSITKLANDHALKTMEFHLNASHFVDGVHLNESGIKKAAEAVSSFILSERGY